MSLQDLISDQNKQRIFSRDFTEPVFRFPVEPDHSDLAAEALELQGTLFAFVRIRIKEATYEE